MIEKSDGMALVQRLIAAWEARDADGIAACFAEDGVWHNMPFLAIAGREKIKSAVTSFLDTATEVRFEVRYANEVAPNVVMNERVDIFRQQDGTEVRFQVAGVFEVQDGLIHEWRDYFDSGAMGTGQPEN